MSTPAREAWGAAHPDRDYGAAFRDDSGQSVISKPGLHASCLPFLRSNDVSVLAWDMSDAAPTGYDLAWTVPGAIHAYGLGLIDNALLEPLAVACREEGRFDFAFVAAPLRTIGGTGSPLNPIAIF